MPTLLLLLTLGVAVPGGARGLAPTIAPAAPDTLTTARRGDRLVLRNLAGHIDVRGWGRDEVRLEAGPSDRAGVGLDRDGNRIVVRDRDRKGRSLERRVEVRVPTWLDLELRGNDLSVRLDGVDATVSVQSVEGDIEVQDGSGTLDLYTVEGEIRVTDFDGRVRARSVDESVTVLRGRGEIEVGSTDGDLILDAMDAGEVVAETVDGDVEFSGAIHRDGAYRFATHGGDVLVEVPEGVDAEVSVSTFDGSFEADFPVRLERFRGGREMSFTLGGGGARLVLQAFDGDIRMRYRR